jgi:DNA repair exonuclease SbcCD ATPase subunit
MVAALPAAALAQTHGTPEQLRTFQLRLDEQQQQLNQQRQKQPSLPQRDQQLQSLQNQLDQQQIELQRLKQQQQTCPPGRCRWFDARRGSESTR